ncbi:MAG TPA: hypothetical protein VHA37_02295, partial [Candidatus Saccharimonadales bacterium]|nr:hypothetical protein [Candidatus Saccharimonadales bacterium]
EAPTEPVAELVQAQAAESLQSQSVPPIESPQLVPAWLRRIGNGALAGVATLLALHVAAPDHAHAQPDHAAHRLPNVPALEQNVTIPTSPPVVRYTPFEIGITTYNSQTDGVPNLYADEQDLGLNGVRESLIRSSWRRDLSQIRADDVAAEAHGEQMAVDLGETATAPRVRFAQWAGHMVALLPADIDRVIIENEVDGTDFYDPGAIQNPTVLMHMYVNQLYQTHQAIKAVRPDMQVCGFGLDSIPANNPLGYLQGAALYAYQEYGGLQNIEDCLSEHSYVPIPRAEALLQAYQSVTSQSIWVDEFGRNLRRGLTPDQQADQYEQFITFLYENPQVQGVNIYHDYNPPVDSPVDQWQTGLRTPRGILLPSGHTVRDLATSFAHTDRLSYTP